MPRYSYTQGTMPNSIDVRQGITDSAMTNKTIEGITWDGTDIHLDFTNTLSSEDQTLLSSVVSSNVNNAIIINQNRYYTESNPEISTNSLSWVQKVSLSLTLGEEQTYLIGYSAEVSSGSNWEIEIQTQLNNSVDLSSYEVNTGGTVNKPLWKSYSGFVEKLLAKGVNTIDLDFRTSNQNKNVSVRKARLHAIKVV